MARLLVLFRQPRVLSAGEVAPWLRAQTERVEQFHGFDVIPLQAATPGGAKQWDWMLELDLGRDRPPGVEEACRELLLDLRLLGTRPVAVVADDDESA